MRDDRVITAPAALRADLDGKRLAASRLYSAAELIDRAADLYCESSALVHQNERRWRVFHTRVESLLANSRERSTIKLPTYRRSSVT